MKSEIWARKGLMKMKNSQTIILGLAFSLFSIKFTFEFPFILLRNIYKYEAT